MSARQKPPSSMLTRRRRGRLDVLVLFGVLVAMVVTGTSCTGSAPDASPNGTAPLAIATSTAGTTPLALTASQRSVAVGTTFDWGAFRMTAGHDVFDRDLKAFALGMRVQNTATIWRQTTWPGAEVRSGSKNTVAFGPVVDLPPGAITEVTLNAQLVADDPLAGGTFHLGTETQPSIDLPLTKDATAGPGMFPSTPVAIDGWASIGPPLSPEIATNRIAMRAKCSQFGMGRALTAAAAPYCGP